MTSAELVNHMLCAAGAPLSCVWEMSLAGIEPTSLASEANALSAELQGRYYNHTLPCAGESSVSVRDASS